MTRIVIVIGAIGLVALFAFAIVWFVRKAFVRHDPERAAASVTVAANVAFELQLPGSPGELFFRFDINGDTESDYDLLVSGEIVDQRGGTRAFAVKTSKKSKIDSADSARYAGITYAVTTCTGSISLATVHTGDRAVRGVVTEHPSALLHTGWVYVARGGGRDMSAADMLAAGQRIRGVLRSFHDTGETARSADLTSSRPELLDAPLYKLKVEFRLTDRRPVIGRNRQQVPLTEVPNLAVGRELYCAVNPADPTRDFVVDWSYRLD